MDIRRLVGLNLKKYRKAAGFSQEGLALECGVHRTYVSGVERGIRNPTVMVLAQLAEPLGIPSAKLLEEPIDRDDDTSRAGSAERPCPLA